MLKRLCVIYLCQIIINIVIIIQPVFSHNNILGSKQKLFFLIYILIFILIIKKLKTRTLKLNIIHKCFHITNGMLHWNMNA